MEETEDLQNIHTRIYASDYRELKRRALVEGVPYQAYLRALIRKALKKGREVR